jgi:hypothetical protein
MPLLGRQKFEFRKHETTPSPPAAPRFGHLAPLKQLLHSGEHTFRGSPKSDHGGSRLGEEWLDDSLRRLEKRQERWVDRRACLLTLIDEKRFFRLRGRELFYFEAEKVCEFVVLFVTVTIG